VWIKVVVILVFIAILVSLGSGLFYLVKDHGDSRRTVKALTFRIGLSVGLFAFLMLLVALGVIKPHGIAPSNPAAETTLDAGRSN
jgi:hypothetical protein